jgi:hypothetical protein
VKIEEIVGSFDTGDSAQHDREIDNTKLLFTKGSEEFFPRPRALVARAGQKNDAGGE